MGKPKFSRKKYETPSHPWQEDRIKAENELIKKYGLKNKREIWKAETSLRKYRGQARELLAKLGKEDPQIKKEGNQLIMHLTRFNILPANSSLDDVLALDTESILSRRLQTLTYLKGLANTPTHARQLINHGHIAIGNRKVTVPSYMITKDEEAEIKYIPDSPLNDLMHPARPRADFKSVPIKKETEKPIEKEPAKPSKKVPVKDKDMPEKVEEKPVEEPPKEVKSEESPKEDKKLPADIPKQQEKQPKDEKTKEKTSEPKPSAEKAKKEEKSDDIKGEK
jgi:small subunit ribosomal protein S4